MGANGSSGTPHADGSARAGWPWPAIARSARARRSLILAYHGVERVAPELDPEQLCVDPDLFRSHVELLAEAGFRFVTVSQLIESAAEDGFPPGSVALSFDDGLANLHSIALPILREYDATATVYVASGLIGQPYPWAPPESGLRLMTEGQIRELAEAGWEIGAHTVSHPDLSVCSYERCLSEMTESRSALEQLTGAPVTTFAYPFARFSPAAVKAAEDAGFRAAVSYSSLTDDANGRFTLARDLVTAKHRAPTIALKARGVYDALFWSRPGRALRVLTRPLRDRPPLAEHQP